MIGLVGALGGAAAVGVSAFVWRLISKRGEVVAAPVAPEPLTQERFTPPQEEAPPMPAGPDPAVVAAALREDLDRATTSDEYYDVYYRAQPGSLIEKESAEKYVAAVRSELARSLTFDDARTVFDGLDIDSLPSRAELRAESAEKLLSLSTEAGQLESLYTDYTGQEGYDAEVAKKIAERLTGLYLVEVSKAGTIEACQDIFNALPSEDGVPVEEVERAALDRALSLVTTATEARELYDWYAEGDHDEEFAQRITTRFDELARQELAACTSIDECWALMNDVLQASESEFGDNYAVEKEAFEKVLELSTTHEEVMSLYGDLPEDYDEEFKVKVLSRALELATDYDEADAVYSEASQDSELERAALAKKLGLIESVEDCQSLWDDFGVDSDYGQMAIIRAAEILKAQQEETDGTS